MEFNRHSNLEGLHAFLGASKFHWIRYDDEKLINTYQKHIATLKGTEYHEYAALAIKLGQKAPRSNKTLCRYINDAIGFNMQPEQVLFYSINCFGTADAISFRNNELRIHDLKTGTIPAHMDQLMIYAALFCLEYKVKPGDIKIVLRIYQNDDVTEYSPEADEILPIMDKIVHFDKLIDKMKEKGV